MEDFEIFKKVKASYVALDENQKSQVMRMYEMLKGHEGPTLDELRVRRDELQYRHTMCVASDMKLKGFISPEKILDGERYKVWQEFISVCIQIQKMESQDDQ